MTNISDRQSMRFSESMAPIGYFFLHHLNLHIKPIGSGLLAIHVESRSGIASVELYFPDADYHASVTISATRESLNERVRQVEDVMLSQFYDYLRLGPVATMRGGIDRTDVDESDRVLSLLKKAIEYAEMTSNLYSKY